MKNLLAFLLLISCLHVHSQVVQKAISIPYTQSGSTRQSLLYTPNDYSSTSTKYPLLVFLHGAGESSGGLSNIYNNSSAGGPAYFMEHNGWPTSFTNPADGQAYKFIVISPQALNTSWSSSGPDLDYMIRYMVANYRVDVNRIYITGLSAGGAGCVQYVTRTNDNGIDFTPQYKIAAYVPMSQANGAISQTLANRIVDDNTVGWGFGSEATDIHGENTHTLINEMNVRKAGTGKYTNYSGGHCCWNTYYNPNYRETINGKSMNIYEWMLTNTRGASAVVTVPTANAGANTSITLPTSTVSLSGSAVAATGHSISSYRWTKINGGAAVITNSASAATTVTGLVAGTYGFRLTVTQDDAQTAYSDVTVTVNAAAVVVANAGSAQTITLPANSVTLNGSSSTGTISSYSWTKVSGGAATIATPTSVNTSVTGLVAGTYTFRLSLNGGASTADVTVTVNAATAPPSAVFANAGTTQNITLPTSSTTLNGSASTGTISSYAWTRISGPNSPTIVSPNAASTTVTGLIAGTYVFQLAVNGSASVSQVTVYVNAASSGGSSSGNACGGKKIYMTPGYGSDLYISPFYGGINPGIYKPGDTLVFKASDVYGDVFIQGLTGTSSCPITIINEGGQVKMKNSHLVDGKYVNWTGTGAPGVQYGFKVQGDPREIGAGVGVSFEGRSKNVLYENIWMDRVGQGVYAHTENTCADSVIYPNWILDSLTVRYCKITNTRHEGMYIGSTAPDNVKGGFDPRPIDCLGNGVITYPRPMRNGYTLVYGNIVDSCGRGGIQLSSASKDISEIYNNVVTHCGMSGIDNQGTGISIGGYARAYVHDNIVRNNYTWGIASLGGSGTGIPIRIENNTIDSSGFLNTYNDQLDEITLIPGVTQTYPPGSLPYANLNFVCGIFMKTTPLMDVDSTMFWIKNNKIGIQNPASKGAKIQLQDGYQMMHKNGNIVCNNTNLSDGTPATFFLEAVVNNITYSTNCSGSVTNPTANAGPNQTITLPTNSVTLTGSGTASTGSSISTYKWTLINGTAATIANASAATTTVTGLVAGGYTFRFTVTDNAGKTATADMQVTVNAQAGNTAPVVNAGSDANITLPVNSVTLNATATDADGSVASYVWTKTSGPTQFTITGATTVSPVVSNLTSGTYVFRLTVTDNKGATTFDDITVIVNPAGSTATGSKYIKTNVYGGVNPYTNPEWNNWNVASSLSTSALKFSDGSASGVTVTISSSQAIADNSATYGGSMAPPEVLRYASYAAEDRTLSISGLTASKTYSIELYASRSSNPNSQTIFTLNGVTYTVNTYNNMNNKVVFNSITPDAKGQINVLIAHASTFTYLNGFIITENGTSSSGTPSTPTAPAPTVTRYVKANIYGGVNPYANAEWNNWNVASSLTTSALKFSDGSASAINAVLSSSQDISDNSASYGGTMAPAEVLRYASYAAEDRTLTISGLTAGKTYSIELYASRNSNPTSQTIFKLNGVSYTVGSYNNLSNKVVFDNIIPDSKGELSILISQANDESFTYLNGFILTENSNLIAARTMTSTTGTLTVESNTTTLSKTGTDETANTLSIYPNPVQDKFTLDVRNNQTGTMSVQIIDQLGAVKSTFTFKKDQKINTINIPANNLARGIYFVKVQIGSWTETKKIIKL